MTKGILYKSAVTLVPLMFLAGCGASNVVDLTNSSSNDNTPVSKAAVSNVKMVGVNLMPSDKKSEFKGSAFLIYNSDKHLMTAIVMASGGKSNTTYSAAIVDTASGKVVYKLSDVHTKKDGTGQSATALKDVQKLGSGWELRVYQGGPSGSLVASGKVQV